MSDHSAEPTCPFCTIAASYPPYPPQTPPPPSSPQLTSSITVPETHLILSTPTLVAFLDILPLAPAHLLLCPRAHRPKLTDVRPGEAADLGRYLPVLSAAARRVTGASDWNVIQNNGAAAAQVVPHVHFHVVPRGLTGSTGGAGTEGRFARSFIMFGRGQREELDDDEGRILAAELRNAVADVLREQEEAQKEKESKL